MEGLGVAASVIAVVQITTKVFELGYKYISGVKGSSANLKRLTEELQLLTGIISQIQNAQDPGSITLQGLDAPLQRYKLEIKNFYDKLESRRNKWNLWGKLQWPLTQSETTGFIKEVESFKLSLILAMSTDQMCCSNAIGTDVLEIRDSRRKEEAEQIDKKLIEIVNWLFPEAFNERHNEISGRRKEGTGRWVLKEPEVTSWRKTPGLLWGYGIPGAGKTFLSSLIIDDLQKQASTSTGKCGVAYVYFNFTEQGKQQPIRVLASLVKQLVCQSRSLPGHLKDLHKRQENPNYEALYKALLEVSASFSETFFVFDALDECHQTTQRGKLLPFFHQIVADSNTIHIFITSREHPEDIQRSFKMSAKIKLWAKDDDIASYVEQKVSENARAKELVEGHMKQIIDELIACANGMFLLVHFHIEYLCQQTTKKQILGELKKLKTSSHSEGPLAPTYDRVMQSIQQQPPTCVELATRILSWLVKARKVLTVRELQLAVSAELSQTSFDEEDLPDQKTMLDVCGSLVAIDEESSTVRLVHYTVQEYLLKHPILEPANSKVAMACVGFLGSDLFTVGACKSQAALKDRMALYPLLNYAGMYLLDHLNSCEGGWREEVPNLLKHSGNLSSYFQAQKYYEWDHDPWDYYPEGYSPLHAAVTLGYIPLIQKVLESGGIKTRDEHGRTPLHTAVMETDINPAPSVTIVTLLLDHGTDASAADKDGRSALYYAAKTLDEKLVSLLLDRGADTSAIDNDEMTALLYVLAAQEREAMEIWEWSREDEEAWEQELEQVQSLVKSLLDHGADASAANKDGVSALHYAAKTLDEKLVSFLLDREADISAIDNNGKTALHYVLDVWGEQRECGVDEMIDQQISEGFERWVRDFEQVHVRGWTQMQVQVQSLIKLLLDHGADVSAANKDGRSALHNAASILDEKLISLLLDRGADISAIDNNGMTALHVVLRKWGFNWKREWERLWEWEGKWDGKVQSLVNFLLDHGADTSAVGNDGKTVLHYAAQALDGELVRLLLDRGADISAVDDNGKTALSYALDMWEDAPFEDPGLDWKHVQPSFKLLLKHGADASAVSYSGKTVLHYAAKELDGELVRLLLDRGADISAVDDNGKTALYHALDICDRAEDWEDVRPSVKLLLDHGADASAVGNNGKTVLHYAAQRLDEELVSLLLDRGADISAVDDDGKTALDYALKKGDQKIVSRLLSYGTGEEYTYESQSVIQDR